MGELVLAGILGWLTVFAWWGLEFLLRPGRRAKAIGAFLLVVAIAPSATALWLAT
jgi:hypothetical protein